MQSFNKPTIEQAAINWIQEIGCDLEIALDDHVRVVKLRDSLLPRLMRGEVRVTDVEEIL